MAHLQIFLPNSDEHLHELDEDKVMIGRVEDNTVCIPDDSVSSHHAEISFDGILYHLHDLGSTNGTFVNSEQVTDAVLQHGDEIRLGSVIAIFTSQAGSASGAHPLPQSAAPTNGAGDLSRCPPNFTSTSPIPRNVKSRDPMALVSLILAGIALAASVAAIGMALTMTA